MNHDFKPGDRVAMRPEDYQDVRLCTRIAPNSQGTFCRISGKIAYVIWDSCALFGQPFTPNTTEEYGVYTYRLIPISPRPKRKL